MKSRTVSKGILAGLFFSLLSAGIATASGAEGNERMSRIERAGAVAERRAESRKVEKFKSEKTDSWLCSYVSPFFCDSFPTLTTTPEPAKSPNRGRN